MHPIKFLAITGLFYATLLAIGGLNQQPVAPNPTVRPTAPVIYAPVTAPSTTAHTAPTSTTTTSTTTAPNTTPVALVGPDTPCQEWIPLAVEQGWPRDRDTLETLASVMWRESRCIADAVSPGNDYGLVQINRATHREWVENLFGVPFEQAMTDPASNLHLAWLLYSSREANGQCGWTPWSLQCR